MSLLYGYFRKVRRETVEGGEPCSPSLPGAVWLLFAPEMTAHMFSLGSCHHLPLLEKLRQSLTGLLLPLSVTHSHKLALHPAKHVAWLTFASNQVLLHPRDKTVSFKTNSFNFILEKQSKKGTVCEVFFANRGRFQTYRRRQNTT